jgi:hypothetical protein
MSDDDNMRHYTTNADGSRVLRGLTVAETEELKQLWEDGREGRDRDRARFIELSRKHEVERIRAVSAEVEARQASKQ